MCFSATKYFAPTELKSCVVRVYKHLVPPGLKNTATKKTDWFCYTNFSVGILATN
jgi:hypothetical protein